MKHTRRSILIPAAIAAFVCAQAATAQVTLGPQNPTIDGNADNWNFGGDAGWSAEGGFVPDTGTLDIGATDLGSGSDFRADIFALEQAAQGAEPITISFRFMFTEEVQPGNNIRVGLRFHTSPDSDSFTGEQNFYIGTDNGDGSLLNEWQSFSQDSVFSPGDAMGADIRTSVNIFGDDDWVSGDVHFDNFSVSTVPEPRTYALIGGFLAAGAVLVRRKLARGKRE